MDDERPSPLLSTYLAKRQDLIRYFALRLRSTAAAEDLVQDMYLRLAGVGPEPIENPAAYLYRLGSNLMLDRLKQQRRALARDQAWRDSSVTLVAGEAASDDPPADEAAAARQRLARLTAALDQLPPQRRRAFTLHKLEGLSHAETAQRMGVSKSAVEKHIIAALQQLTALLGEEGLT